MDKIKSLLSPGADKDNEVLYDEQSKGASSSLDHKGQISGEGSHFKHHDGPTGTAVQMPGQQQSVDTPTTATETAAAAPSTTTVPEDTTTTTAPSTIAATTIPEDTTTAAPTTTAAQDQVEHVGTVSTEQAENVSRDGNDGEKHMRLTTRQTRSNAPVQAEAQPEAAPEPAAIGTAVTTSGSVAAPSEALGFGEKWHPATEAADDQRRAQIVALASSRAEKVAATRPNYLEHY